MYAIDALFILVVTAGIGALSLAICKLLEVIGIIDELQDALGFGGDYELLNDVDKTSR